MTTIPDSSPDVNGVVVTHRSPTRRQGFAQVPHAVTTDPALSDGAVRLYALLHSYAFQADIFRCSQEKMAKDIGKDVRTIRRLLKDLHGRGLVTPVRTGNRLVNAYVLEDAYALYDSEQPRPKKQVRAAVRPAKNVPSPDRTKMSGRGGQKSPVMGDKNVPLLKNSGNKKEKEPEVSPSALEKTEDQKAVYKQGAARLMAALEAAQKGVKP